MCSRLAETKARIQHDLLTGNALLHARVCAPCQKVPNFGNYIPVLGLLLHGFRCSLHVHQAHRHTQPCCQFYGTRCLQGIHVVDQPRPGGYCRLHHLGFAGVD